MRLLLFAAVLVFAMSACSEKSAFPMDRAWTLSIMNGQKMSGDNAFTLNFDAANKGYSGKACNSYRGTYTMEKSKLTFGPGATTKMMCPNQAKEDEYLKTLGSVDGYRYAGNSLYLTAGGKDVLMYK